LAQVRPVFDREHVLANCKPETVNIPLSPLARDPGVRWRQPFTWPKAETLRIHFIEPSEEPAQDWEIRILEPEPGHDVLWSKKAGQNTREFWSASVPNNSVIELQSAAPRGSLHIKIDKISVDLAKVTPQAITPPNQLASIVGQPKKFRDWGRSVARIRFMGDNGYSYFCTGFLIGTDVLMTNQHCMQSDAEVNSTEVDFDYDDKDAKRVTMTLLKREFVDASLDVAIYRIAGQTGRDKLHLADLVPDNGRALLIIQHPGGEPKQISEEDCVVQGVSLRGVSQELRTPNRSPSSSMR